MSDAGLICRDDFRHEQVRESLLFGLDYVELGDDQRTLHAVFLGAAPPKIARANVRIEGGRRIRDVAVLDVAVHRQRVHTLDDTMDVVVDKSGDFSTYTLRVVALDAEGHPTSEPMEGFDPRYASVEFSFKAGCPSDLDCRPAPTCVPTVSPAPALSYLAKDYASFRQLILDRLALTMPDWRERHVPDVGIALVEILAYVGDYLSYYQDAVATEAYLGTARQRISVRRHARLVDYAMHEGCNARAWVAVSTTQDETFNAKQVYFITGFPGAPLGSRVLAEEDIPATAAGSYVVFEPIALGGDRKIHLRAAHSEIQFYTWGDDQCCLAAGATAATLVDPGQPAAATGTGYGLALKPGDVLVVEERIGPRTGNPADADPRHRQAVRLTKVTRSWDPLTGQPLVEVEWGAEDALAFSACLSSRADMDDCRPLRDVTIALGNVLLVDHGETVVGGEDLGTVCASASQLRCPTECDPGDVTVTPARFRPALTRVPLTFAEPIPPCASARTLVAQDPRHAHPAVELTGTRPTPHGTASNRWWARADLLESAAGDDHFVVEIDNEGVAHLRFGDGRLGSMPDVDTSFRADYRIGNGTAGNVGADRIRYLVLRGERVSGSSIEPRNPLPASGGTDPEPIADVKLFAPDAFRAVLERAITGDDYATLAADNDRRRVERIAGLGAHEHCPDSFREIDRAKGELRWTGSRYEAYVAIDPRGSEDVDAALVTEVEAYLDRYRRVGHDVVVGAAVYVPLDLALHVCVSGQYVRGHVEAAVLDEFSTRTLANGTLGFFHPDRWTFGDDIAVSTIVAAAQAIPGVVSVEVTRLRRYQVGTRPQRPQSRPHVPAGGVLKLGPFEIAQLDNDPSFPERGRLTLDLRGGR